MDDMDNPFKYGVPVTGADFVDRDAEIAELVRELRSGKSIVVYSNRRMGKTSYLAEVARRHRKDFIFVYVDVYGMTNQTHFLEEMAKRTIAASYGKTEKMVEAVRELLGDLAPRFILSDRGTIGLEFARRDPNHGDLLELFDLPETISRAKNKRVVIMFDEFQEIAALDGVALLKTMRSRFQLHKSAVYVFCGSKRHLLYNIFEEYEGAFYKFARPLELGPVPDDEFEKFLVDRFRSGGGRLDPKFARKILSVSRGSPYYTQQIAHELFAITETPSAEADVDLAVDMTLAHQSPAYAAGWDLVKSPLQRSFLLAIASEPTSIYGWEFVKRHGLRSPSHVQKIERSLRVKGIVEKGRIVDPIFALWLKRMGEGT